MSRLTTMARRVVFALQSALAPLRQAVRSSFDFSALEQGGGYRDVLQHQLAAEDAPEGYALSATLR